MPYTSVSVSAYKHCGQMNESKWIAWALNIEHWALSSSNNQKTICTVKRVRKQLKPPFVRLCLSPFPRYPIECLSTKIKCTLIYELKTSQFILSLFHLAIMQQSSTNLGEPFKQALLQKRITSWKKWKLRYESIVSMVLRYTHVLLLLLLTVLVRLFIFTFTNSYYIHINEFR